MYYENSGCEGRLLVVISDPCMLPQCPGFTISEVRTRPKQREFLAPMLRRVKIKTLNP